MSEMNEFLASYYNTGSTSSQPSSEDVEKQAQIELFSKLASDNNIDLTTLSDEQVVGLWSQFQKQAEDDKKPDDKKEKMDKAKEEHEEKKEAQAKLAEADFLGRVMAHSYVDELKKIAAATSEPDEVPEVKEAGKAELLHKLRNAPGAAAAAAPKALHKLRNAPGEAARALPGKMHDLRSAAGHAAEKVKAHASEHKGHAAAAAGGAAVGAAGMAAMKHKKASALDDLAVDAALQKVAAANYDSEEAATLLAAVLELPLSENTKIASVTDFETAIEVRSLELLEMAGYPVTWNS